MELFSILLPEVSVLLLGLAIIITKLVFHNKGFRGYGWLAAGWLALTLVLMLMTSHQSMLSWGGMYFVDAFATYFKGLLIVCAILVILGSISYVNKRGHHEAEYHAITVFALLGMMIFSASGDLITMYIGLELMSISFAILIAFLRKDNLSTEGAIKYLILSALSSAVMLYGLTLIYGFTGTTIFAEMLPYVGSMTSQPLFIVAIMFVLAGFAFKVSAVPFHMWAPDIYQGAPTPVAGFLAVGSKAAALALMSRVFLNIFADQYAVWAPLVLIMALFSIVFGNLVAIPQRDVKRMLGYSSIAQVGYLLLGILAAGEMGAAALMFYVTAYTFANVGAFIAVTAIEEKIGSTNVADYPGLSKRSPFLAAAFFIFLISLGGLPPMGGFIGKFLLFTSAIDAGYLWLAIIGLLMSMISVYYYFTVVRAMYVTEPKVEELPKINVSASIFVALFICIIGSFVTGIFFQPVMELALHASQFVVLM